MDPLQSRHRLRSTEAATEATLPAISDGNAAPAGRPLARDQSRQEQGILATQASDHHPIEKGKRMSALSTDALDQLFVHTQTHNDFTSKPVPKATLRRLYDLMK